MIGSEVGGENAVAKAQEKHVWGQRAQEALVQEERIEVQAQHQALEEALEHAQDRARRTHQAKEQAREQARDDAVERLNVSYTLQAFCFQASNTNPKITTDIADIFDYSRLPMMEV